MFGVELAEEKASLGPVVQGKMIEKGFLTDFHSTSNTFRFFPPYVITYEEIDEFNNEFRETLSKL
jgi:acetylornithine/succinyldiaminopimelate/putrescine aminotransferase